MLILTGFRSFAFRHDDLPAFHAGYLILVLIAASMFSLGAFAMLILAHMTLDYIKYREHLGYNLRLTAEGMIRESLMDITLLMIGLVFSVYLNHSIAITEISGVMKAEMTIIRMFGTLIPKIKIMHNFLKVISHIRHYRNHAHPHLRNHWSPVDRVCFWSIGMCAVLLIFSAKILNVEYTRVWEILREEIVPRLMS